MRLEIATIQDAKELLSIQKRAFRKYSLKYGDFDSNPYHMNLHRMEFNIKYRLGHYHKIIEDDKIVGGIFAFMLDDENIYKIAQFYVAPHYQKMGLGTIAFDLFLKSYPQINKWFIDTIMQEEANVDFYKKFGFKIIDEEEEHEGLTFLTMLKEN